jgi:hypothetical protein
MSPLLKSPISEPHEVLNTSSPPERTPLPWRAFGLAREGSMAAPGSPVSADCASRSESSECRRDAGQSHCGS